MHLQRIVSTCSFDVPEDAHRGGVITSQTTLCRNFGGKEGGGRIFEGGVLAEHYGSTKVLSTEEFWRYQSDGFIGQLTCTRWAS